MKELTKKYFIATDSPL